MKKKKLIKEIKAIIQEYGSFSVGEVLADCSPCVGSLGRMVALAEYFGDDVEVFVYDPKGYSSDPMDNYIMAYEELDKDILESILELAKDFKEMTLEEV